MLTPFDDILTPRLVLRLMDKETISACLAGDLASAEGLLGAVIPAELLDNPSSLNYNQHQLKTDPQYVPWSARAIILPNEKTMIGLVRFHSSPDPEYLHQYVRDAVELGYRIFNDYRRLGYATEAIKAMMEWAQVQFNIFRFIASVSPENSASLYLMDRFGFIKIGEVMDETDGIEHVFLRIATR